MTTEPVSPQDNPPSDDVAAVEKLIQSYDRIREELEANGKTVKTENQNYFKLKGKSGTVLAGKPNRILSRMLTFMRSPLGLKLQIGDDSIVQFFRPKI